ncbi:MAG: hypothetical protein OXI08_00385 [Cyanobacteria bacterium MAG IRC4_bin_6]|nr:hypothetical protein [Cyanobacteria bacterium MAG IRC4_bin_6]
MTCSEQHTALFRIDLRKIGKRDHGSWPHAARGEVRDDPRMAASRGC